MSMSWTPFEQAGPCWKSGLYKIVFYERISVNYGKPGYTAYYIRKGDKNWGYHVEPRNPYYDTLDQAQAACETHWSTVQDEPWVNTMLRHLEMRGNG